MGYWSSLVERVFPGARQITEDYDRRAVDFRVGAALAFTPQAVAKHMSEFGANVEVTIVATRDGWGEPALDVQLKQVAFPVRPA